MPATTDRIDEGSRTAHLRLRALGEQTVALGDAPLHFPTRHAAQALFRLALSPDGAVPVAEMSASLWPDAPESRLPRRLATLTWQLRRTLGDEGTRVLRNRTTLSLHRDGISIDVLEMRRRAVQEHGDGGLSDEVVAALGSSVLPAWASEQWVQDVMIENNALLERLR